MVCEPVGFCFLWAVGGEDQMRTPAKGDACSVIGNSERCKGIERNGTAEVGALWESTPLILRKAMRKEAFATYGSVDVGTYDFGNTPIGEQREEGSGCPRVEFLDEMGEPNCERLSSAPEVFNRIYRRRIIRRGGSKVGGYGYRVGEGGGRSNKCKANEWRDIPF